MKKTSSKTPKHPEPSATLPEGQKTQPLPLDEPATARPSDHFITQGLRRLLAEKHDVNEIGMGQEWALFYELRSGAGFGNQISYVDAFALNLWPSKKHWRVAYELKASRADFLRELKKPEKRSWAMEISNEFWYVCYPGVAKPEEIPQGCGLLVANEDLTKLRRTVVAPQRDARELKLSEVSAIARRSTQESTALFRFAGKELTESDLRGLLKSREDHHFHAAVHEAAAVQAAAVLASVEATLRGYARDLDAAGLPAPEWMKSADLSKPLKWDSRAWAKEVFLEGPGVTTLQTSLQEVQRAQARLEQAKEAVDRAMGSVEGLLKRKKPDA